MSKPNIATQSVVHREGPLYQIGWHKLSPNDYVTCNGCGAKIRYADRGGIELYGRSFDFSVLCAACENKRALKSALEHITRLQLRIGLLVLVEMGFALLAVAAYHVYRCVW